MTESREERTTRRYVGARRLLKIALAALVLVLVVAFVGYRLLDRKIQTFSGSGITHPDVGQAPSASPGHGENVLLLGSDTRVGENAALGGTGGAVGRSDTTLLVHIYPRHRRAVAVSIPRDSLVTIPRCRLPDGQWTKPQRDATFNSAFTVGQTESGNPGCTVDTVQRLTGLQIDHTIVASFAGFAAVSKAVGGVRVCLPAPVYQGDLDPSRTTPGRQIFHAGVQKVSGVRALQYVRVRHGLGDGSDIGRIRRQQAFLGSMIRTIRHRGLDPTHLWPLIDAATANLTFDPTLDSPRKLLDFALDLRHLEPARITFLTVPWAYDGARVRIVQPAADRLWAALGDDQPLQGARQASSGAGGPMDRRVSSTTVNVYNGTTRPGLAAELAARVQRLGFRIGDVAGAARHHAATRIEYGPGQRALAGFLSRHLTAQLVPRTETGLRVVLGTKHTWTAHPDSASQHHAAPLPPQVTDHLRSATSGPCSNDSYG